MTIPAAPSASQYDDAIGDDPKQARAQFLAHQQAYLQTRSFQGGEMGSLTATDAGTLDIDSVDAGTIYVAAQAGSPSPVISDLGTPTRGAPWKLLVFDAGITIQHAAGSLELPGAANITTEDGDSAVVVYDSVGSPGFWRVISYTRAAHSVDPQLPFAWVNFNGTGTVAIRDSFNVSSITDNGTGNYTVNFDTNASNANYAALLTTQDSGGARVVMESNRAVGSIDVIGRVAANDASSDREHVNLVVFGGT